MKNTTEKSNSLATNNTDETLRLILHINHRFDAQNQEHLAQIQKIKYLASGDSLRGVGFGLINFGTPEEKLVEYSFAGDEGFMVKEISLKDSVQWMLHMQFADGRFGTAHKSEPLQDDDTGMTRWLEMIAAAVK